MNLTVTFSDPFSPTPELAGNTYEVACTWQGECYWTGTIVEGETEVDVSVQACLYNEEDGYYTYAQTDVSGGIKAFGECVFSGSGTWEYGDPVSRWVEFSFSLG